MTTTTKDNATLAALCRCLPYAVAHAEELRQRSREWASRTGHPQSAVHAVNYGKRAEEVERDIAAARQAIASAALEA